MGTDKLTASPRASTSTSAMSRFTQEQSARFLRIVVDALDIERHYQLFLWLRGEIQDLVPHEVLISASGDFATWLITLDVVSSLPGVRTKQLAYVNIDPFVEAAYSRWVKGDRQPLLLDAKNAYASLAERAPHMHRALREMQTIFVHGVHDFRNGHDSVYMMHSRESLDDEAKERRFSLLELLIPQIDMAFRRVASLPIAVRKGKGRGEDRFNLSVREQEILDLLCRGESNSDIAATLAISPFTVKNHLQRIFKKIGVNNRTQAATKYNDALRELRKLLT